MTRDPLPVSVRRYRLLLAFILLLALAVRVAYVLYRPASEAALADLPDQIEYLTLGRNLLHQKELVFYDERFQQAIHAYRMPLYPAFIAACGGHLRIVQLVQAAVDASTVVAVAWLALALLPPARRRGGALVAAGIVALNPFLVFFSALLLSETLFTALLAWGMLLIIVGGQGGRMMLVDDAGDVRPYRRWCGTLLWLLGGLVLAASTLVRPSAAPLAVIMGIAGSFANRPMRGSGVVAFRPRWPLPVATTMMLLTAAILFPWAYRNRQVVGQWLWTTSNSGVTAYDGFNPDATGASDQSMLRTMPQLAQMNELERSAYLSSRANRFVREHPRRALELAAIKAARTWSPVPLSADYSHWTYRLVGIGYSLPLDVLVLLGLLASPLRRSVKVVLLAPALYFTLVHMASVGSLRYRIPVEPPLAVLAAAGLATLKVPPMGWRRAGDVAESAAAA